MLEIAIRLCEELPAEERKLTVRCSHSLRLLLEVGCPVQGEIKFDKKGLPTQPDGRPMGSAHSIATFCDRHGAGRSFQAESGWLQMIVSV